MGTPREALPADNPGDDPAEFAAPEAETGELEERVVHILSLPEAEQSEAFVALRSEYPAAAELLRRWEIAAQEICTEPNLAATVRDVGRRTTADVDVSDRIPHWIAGYRIDSVLGEGGMGTVYLAEQLEPVRRNVALKVVKLGMDTKQILARFELERRALAVMNHDAIAKVFDAGQTERGQPYFVMEYAPGVPITEYCDRYRLNLRERVELFQQLCNGVQHAHQKGVIHRDLKPGNVLVVRDAERHAPKIIDFGLARALHSQVLAHSMFTEHGQFVGTPEYMSPEQAGLDPVGVDTRTDVYSLGVLLYEIVAGELPFSSVELRRGGYPELLRTLRESDPPKPSSRVTTVSGAPDEAAGRRRTSTHALARELRGDLDWIVLKAMAKEPDRRYGSASELAQDLGRYLAHEPVAAGPPSTRYRLRKLVRRNRAQFIATAVVAVVFLGGVIGTLVGLFAAKAQEKLATERADKIALQRDEIQIEATTATEVAAFMIEMFEVSNPSRARGNSIKAREILDKSAARIDALKDQPEVRARLLKSMGDVYRNLGLYAEAAPLLAQSLEIRRHALGDDHPETLRTLDAVGKLAWDRENLQDAARFHKEALAGRRTTLGDDDRETLSSMNNYGLALRDLGNLEEGEKWLRRSLEGRRRLLGNEHRETLVSMGNVGQVLLSQGRLEAAKRHYSEVLQTRRRVLGDDHPDTLISINDMGMYLYKSGKPVAAEKLFRQGLAESRVVLGNDHRETLNILGNLGSVLMSQGRHGDAEPFCLECLEGYRRVLGSEATRTLAAMTVMARLLSRQWKKEKAEAMFRDVMVARRRIQGDDHPATLQSIHDLARFLESRSRATEAEPLLVEVVQARRRALGDDDRNTLIARADLGSVWTRLERYAEAHASLAAALDGLRSQEFSPLGIAHYQRFNGHCLLRLKRFEQAEEAWLEAHGVLESKLGRGQYGTVRIVRRLVELYKVWGKLDRAAEWQAKIPGKPSGN